MNNQEFFTKTVTHLRQQGAKSFLRNLDGTPMMGEMRPQCAYRDGPRSCAVGCHIPDDLYDSSLEGVTVYSIMRKPDLSPIWSGVHPDLLGCMQSVHDLRKLKDWEQAFADVANSWGLELP